MTSSATQNNVHTDDGAADGYAAAAPLYWERGWSPLPLPRGCKTYPPKRYTGHDGLYPSYPDVLQWAESHIDGNVALRLPPNVIGIDVDHYGDKTGGRTFAEAERRWGPLPPTVMSTSRDDGINGIRLYRIPEGVELPGALWIELDGGTVTGDIEIIQRHHRYVVAWPSIHPSGSVYQWLNPEGEVVGIPEVAAIPELPEKWLQELVSRAGTSVRVRPDRIDPTVVARAQTSGDPSVAVKTRLADALVACNGTSGVGRHDATRNHVLALMHLGKDGEPGVKVALDTLGEQFVNAVAPDRKRGEPEARAEFTKMVEGPRMAELLTDTGIALGADGTVYVSDGEGLPSRAETELDQAVAKRLLYLTADKIARDQLATRTATVIELPPVRSLDALLAEPDQPVRMKIESVWPAGGGRVICAAPAGAGKTTMSGSLIRSLVDGDPFLDTFEVHERSHRIVVIDMEMTGEMLKRWLRRQGVVNTAAVADVVTLRGQTHLFDLGNDKLVQMWTERLRDLGADFVIFDCLKPALDAMGLKESTETGVFTTAFYNMLEAAGVTDCLIHHHMGHTAERARGDSSLLGVTDANWNLIQEDPDAPRFFATRKVRDAESLVPDSLLTMDPTTGRLSCAVGTDRAAATANTTLERKQAEIVAVLADNHLDGKDGMNTGDLKRAVGGKKDVTAKALDLAVTTGLVTKGGVEGSRAVVYRPVNPCDVCGKPQTPTMVALHAECGTDEKP